MANRTPILLRPHWIITNQLTMPLLAVNEKGTATVRGLVQMIIPVTIFLDTMFSDKDGYTSRRSFDNEQFLIYKSMEGILQTTGINGKACLLRTICEMQSNPIGEFTVVGEIITILLTPKRGINDFLHEYLEAEHIGQSTNMTCAKEFAECPVSLYNIFRSANGDSNEIPDDDDEYNDENENLQSELFYNDEKEEGLQLPTSSRDTTAHVVLENERQHSLNSLQH